MRWILGLVRVRSGFKTSGQVQGQGAGRSITRSPANGGMSMHLSEVCNAAIGAF